MGRTRTSTRTVVACITPDMMPLHGGQFEYAIPREYKLSFGETKRDHPEGYFEELIPTKVRWFIDRHQRVYFPWPEVALLLSKRPNAVARALAQLNLPANATIMMQEWSVDKNKPTLQTMKALTRSGIMQLFKHAVALNDRGRKRGNWPGVEELRRTVMNKWLPYIDQLLAAPAMHDAAFAEKFAEYLVQIQGQPDAPAARPATMKGKKKKPRKRRRHSSDDDDDDDDDQHDESNHDDIYDDDSANDTIHSEHSDHSASTDGKSSRTKKCSTSDVSAAPAASSSSSPAAASSSSSNNNRHRDDNDDGDHHDDSDNSATSKPAKQSSPTASSSSSSSSSCRSASARTRRTINHHHQDDDDDDSDDHIPLVHRHRRAAASIPVSRRGSAESHDASNSTATRAASTNIASSSANHSSLTSSSVSFPNDNAECSRRRKIARISPPLPSRSMAITRTIEVDADPVSPMSSRVKIEPESPSMTGSYNNVNYDGNHYQQQRIPRSPAVSVRSSMNGGITSSLPLALPMAVSPAAAVAAATQAAAYSPAQSLTATSSPSSLSLMVLPEGLPARAMYPPSALLAALALANNPPSNTYGQQQQQQQQQQQPHQSHMSTSHHQHHHGTNGQMAYDQITSHAHSNLAWLQALVALQPYMNMHQLAATIGQQQHVYPSYSSSSTLAAAFPPSGAATPLSSSSSSSSSSSISSSIPTATIGSVASSSGSGVFREEHDARAMSSLLSSPDPPSSSSPHLHKNHPNSAASAQSSSSSFDNNRDHEVDAHRLERLGCTLPTHTSFSY